MRALKRASASVGARSRPGACGAGQETSWAKAGGKKGKRGAAGPGKRRKERAEKSKQWAFGPEMRERFFFFLKSFSISELFFFS